MNRRPILSVLLVCLFAGLTACKRTPGSRTEPPPRLVPIPTQPTAAPSPALHEHQQNEEDAEAEHQKLEDESEEIH